MTTCGPVDPETGRAHRCYTPPASGNVDRCPLHDAAPDLLAALQVLTLDPRIAPHIDRMAMEQAQAAIAKACPEPESDAADPLSDED